MMLWSKISKQKGLLGRESLSLRTMIGESDGLDSKELHHFSFCHQPTMRLDTSWSKSESTKRYSRDQVVPKLDEEIFVMRGRSRSSSTGCSPNLFTNLGTIQKHIEKEKETRVSLVTEVEACSIELPASKFV
jgi:hypothetical protein